MDQNMLLSWPGPDTCLSWPQYLSELCQISAPVRMRSHLLVLSLLSGGSMARYRDRNVFYIRPSQGSAMPSALVHNNHPIHPTGGNKVGDDPSQVKVVLSRPSSFRETWSYSWWSRTLSSPRSRTVLTDPASPAWSRPASPAGTRWTGAWWRTGPSPALATLTTTQHSWTARSA